MTLLVVASPDNGDGKTTVAIGLLQRLRRLDREVTYQRLPGPGDAADAAFVAGVLGGPDLTPLPPFPAREGGRTGTSSPLPAPGRGGPEGPPGSGPAILEASSLGDARAAIANGAVPLIVVAYQSSGLADKVRACARALGHPRPLLVFDGVPEKGERGTRLKVIPEIADVAEVLGMLPEDRVLRGMSVGDLARALGAEVLCAADELERPVEAVMIAAMSDEGAEEYFARVARKAVVCAGDRPDIQLPALATDTSCLVLTEGADPDPTVFELAEDQGVPLLKVQPDTLTTLERISEALEAERFSQRSKLARALALVEECLDQGKLLSALGLDEAL